MTEQPEDAAATIEETVAACRAAHGYVYQALKALRTPDDYDADSEIEHALRWLSQTGSALSRYIQAHTPDCPPPPRETDPNPEPEGSIPPPPGPGMAHSDRGPQPDVQRCA